MKFKRRKGRQITRAKKHVVDGITFASGLEVYCYRALIKAKIPNVYETKGLRTPEFRMRFKLFLRLLHDSGQDLDVYIPSNQKEVDATIELILSRGNL